MSGTSSQPGQFWARASARSTARGRRSGSPPLTLSSVISGITTMACRARKHARPGRGRGPGPDGVRPKPRSARRSRSRRPAPPGAERPARPSLPTARSPGCPALSSPVTATHSRETVTPARTRTRQGSDARRQACWYLDLPNGHPDLPPLIPLPTNTDRQRNGFTSQAAALASCTPATDIRIRMPRRA